MTDNDSDQGVGGLASLTEQLSQAAAGVDRDDPSVLAKMHGWCEAILAPADLPEGQPSPELCEGIRAAVGMLELLVLGQADDAEATLASLKQTVQECCGTASCEPPTDQAPRPDQTEGDASVPNEVDVAERMAKVFDDDPVQAATKAPAEVAASDEAASIEVEQVAPAPAEPAYQPEPLVLNQKEIEFVQGFVEEAREHIEAIESAVLEVERAPQDAEKIDDLFRPFHTIKGMAGFLNLRDINCLTHEVETLMDQARRGQRTITHGLIDLVFDVVDVLKAQVNATAAHLAKPQGEVVSQPPVVEMIGYLRSVVAGKAEPSGRQPEAGCAAQKTGENLVDQGAVAKEAVEFALETQKSGRAGKKTGEILVEDGAVTPRQVSQAIRPQTRAGTVAGTGGATVGERSIRIDTAKLDQLVDMVGELVIAQTLVSTNPRVATDEKLTRDVGQVGKIVRDVQEAGMGMRMVPIGATFQRMARLVRDVSRKAGKTVELHISGEETELDKNVIQQIGDPLVHMVRNAVDHGIEPPEDRRECGKDGVGHVYLSAYHHAGNIVIDIRDDGKGLDREVLFAKAVEKGVVEPNAELNDQQVFGLVFAAGFSTAEAVTDISGRGVGMDVVKRNIDQLRGRVEISSEKGKGSTFSICLPLTLAIIDGMIVRVGEERFVIPTIGIEQSLRPVPEQITTVQHKGEILQVRGELVPLIQLGQLFGLTGRIDPCQAMVAIALCDDRKIGIVVEELIGQQQVVIKTLGERFEALRGVSGAAILGDGRVGLILEMLGLETLHNTCRSGLDRVDRLLSDAHQAERQETGEPTSTRPEAPPDEVSAEAELVLN